MKDFAPQIYRKLSFSVPTAIISLKDKLEIQVLSIYEKVITTRNRAESRWKGKFVPAMSGQGRPAVGIMAGAVLSEETRYYKRVHSAVAWEVAQEERSRSLPKVWHAM